MAVGFSQGLCEGEGRVDGECVGEHAETVGFAEKAVFGGEDV